MAGKTASSLVSIMQHLSWSQRQSYVSFISDRADHFSSNNASNFDVLPLKNQDKVERESYSADEQIYIAYYTFKVALTQGGSEFFIIIIYEA